MTDPGEPQKSQRYSNERARLQEALNPNKPLATANYMKEYPRVLWNQLEKTSTDNHLQDWILGAETSRIRLLKEFAKTLRIHGTVILSYYDYPIST